MGANGVYDCNKASPLKKTINADADDPARRPTRLATMYWRICKFTINRICVAKLKKVKIRSSTKMMLKNHWFLYYLETLGRIFEKIPKTCSRAGVLRAPWPPSTVKHTVSRRPKSGAQGTFPGVPPEARFSYVLRVLQVVTLDPVNLRKTLDIMKVV